MNPVGHVVGYLGMEVEEHVEIVAAVCCGVDKVLYVLDLRAGEGIWAVIVDFHVHANGVAPGMSQGHSVRVAEREYVEHCIVS